MSAGQGRRTHKSERTCQFTRPRTSAGLCIGSPASENTCMQHAHTCASLSLACANPVFPAMLTIQRTHTGLFDYSAFVSVGYNVPGITAHNQQQQEQPTQQQLFSCVCSHFSDHTQVCVTLRASDFVCQRQWSMYYSKDLSTSSNKSNERRTGNSNIKFKRACPVEWAAAELRHPVEWAAADLRHACPGAMR